VAGDVNKILASQLHSRASRIGSQLLLLLQEATRAIYNQAARCVAAEGWIFESLLEAQVSANEKQFN
jgi:hypothetical protein